MIEENFVTYDQAKKLVKVVDEFRLAEIIAAYDEKTKLLKLKHFGAEISLMDDIITPLKQQVFKYFRDKHKLFVSIDYSTVDQKDFVVSINKKIINDKRDSEYSTFEEAESFAIDELIVILENL